MSIDIIKIDIYEDANLPGLYFEVDIVQVGVNVRWHNVCFFPVGGPN
jgi:hypothetical protein